jgi:lipopolysaccharide/colanic/teichoic acid biosynthesis glycosyltransferase
MKRVFDNICSFFGLIALLPLLSLIIIMNIFFQGFPVFYLHSRLGKGGKPFKLIKFRTMLNGPSLSAKDDVKRITIWGRILRKTSIDELPVLLNVLKGEMSLVGPRPMPVKYLNRFNSSQKKRLYVLPGITGLAQVKGRNHLSWEERFNYDVDYVKNQSFILDIKILLFTIIIVFRGIGVTSKDQEIMPEFLGETTSNKTEK